ncbi:retropepsin-like aspartic protease [Sphingomonas faeni]
MPASIPTMRDKAGLVRAAVVISGLTQNAILDTGANLSVMSASAAKRLGLRIRDGAGRIASPSSGQIVTRVAVADRLVIAGVELAHVASLVMDDAQLSFPIVGGYQIDAIAGFSVFRAVGQTRFDWAGDLPWEGRRAARWQVILCAQAGMTCTCLRTSARSP